MDFIDIKSLLIALKVYSDQVSGRGSKSIIINVMLLVLTQKAIEKLPTGISQSNYEHRQEEDAVTATEYQTWSTESTLTVWLYTVSTKIISFRNINVINCQELQWWMQIAAEHVRGWVQNTSKACKCSEEVILLYFFAPFHACALLHLCISENMLTHFH